jgi:hypothetical protein
MWLPCEAKLLSNVWIVKKIVLPEDASLSLLVDQLLVGDDICRVYLGNYVDTIGHISGAIACSANLTSLCLSVHLETFG